MPTLRDELNTSEHKSKNRNKNSEWPGIVEPAPKLWALKIVYGGISSDRELAQKIVDNDPLPAPASTRDLVDEVMFLIKNQWLKHKPKAGISQHYVKSVVAYINKKFPSEQPGRMTDYMWVNGTYAEFLNVLPQEIQDLFEPHSDCSDDTSFDEGGVVSKMSFPTWRKFDSIRKWTESGRVDQKFYYTTPDSVENWEGVISAGEYPLYDECREALSAMTKNEVWQNFFSRDGGRAIVILGGGCASKDIILIKGALKHLPTGEMLYYRVIDNSNYMSTSAYQIVYANILRDKLLQHVDPHPIHWDFMNLRDLKSTIRQENKKLAWIIPGNTFGNICERDFLRSIRGNAFDGDLLVIGTETIDSNRKDESAEASADHYRIPALRNFVKPALKDVWDVLKLKGTLGKLQDDIVVTPRQGLANWHSDVPGSVTIELSLPLAGRDPLVLLTSTKYLPEKLVEFVGCYGFKKEDIVNSPLNPLYKQFVFRYVS